MKHLKRKEFAKALTAFQIAEAQGFHLERVYIAAAKASREIGLFDNAQYYYKKVINERPKWLA